MVWCMVYGLLDCIGFSSLCIKVVYVCCMCCLRRLIEGIKVILDLFNGVVIMIILYVVVFCLKVNLYFFLMVVMDIILWFKDNEVFV